MLASQPILDAMQNDQNPLLAATHNGEEEQYLGLVSRIIDQGERRSDRTGTGTLSLFAPPQLSFSLGDNVFPLLTTKRVFIRPVIEELLWFIRGHTDSKLLTNKDVHIWDANGSMEFLHSVGLGHRREGDLGPVYGFQWRHFGANYVDADTDYSGQGVDQLRQVIDKIKNNPHDRRIILSAWNPAALKDMALPPCHMFCQFYVSDAKSANDLPTLSCQLYQRSCDMGLGVPFNIASYSALTIMLAYVCGMQPGRFTHCMGDTHIYSDHIEPLQTQLQRTPRTFPKLFLTPCPGEPEDPLQALKERQAWSVDRALAELERFEFDRFQIMNYDPYPKIVMKMSA